MKSRILLALTVVLAAALTSGCISRAIKESASVATGAKGVLAEVQAPGSLAPYTTFELGTFTDGMGGQIPRDLWTHLPGKFAAHLADKNLAGLTGGKALVLRGTIVHYEGEGLAGLLWGDFEEVIARVEMVDKKTNAVIGVANCIGRSTTTARKGVENKADGLAKSLVSWIEKHYPRR
jgi:hypothetical protein